MSLQIWLPMTKDLRNQGLANVIATNNGATFDSDGKLGGCYSFDGNDDFISLNSSILYDVIKGGSNPFSIAMWVYRADSTRAILFGDYMLSGAINFNIEIFANHSMRFYWNTAPDVTGSHTLATLNAWTHLAITYDGTKICFYTNGVLTDTYTVTLTTKTKTSGMYYLGRDSRTGSTTLNGKINDFRLYDHALSPMEVKQISQGLVLHYPLNNNGWGQENLLKYTDVSASNMATMWNYGTNTMEIVTKDNKQCYHFKTTQTSSGIHSGKITNIYLNSNTTYTFSYWIKSSAASNFNFTKIGHFQVYNSSSTATDKAHEDISSNRIYSHSTLQANKWTHVWVTFTTNNLNNSDFRLYIWYLEPNVDYWAYGFKLEKGSIATPWCPNSSDALATTLGMNDGIEYDISGFGNNGAKVGELSWSSNTPKYNASLDITTDSCARYIYGSHFKFLNEAVTMSCWIYLTSLTATSGGNSTNSLFIMGQDRDYSIYGFGLRVNAGIPYLYITTVTSGNKAINSGTSSVLNSWHHIVGTYDGTNAKIYVDGILKGTQAMTGLIDWDDTNPYKFVIGKMSYGYTSNISYFPFIGYISDARIYATALSADDVKSLYQNCATIDPDGTIRGQIRN